MHDSMWIKLWTKADGLRLGLATITPDMAREFLKAERYTRGTSAALVRRYARHFINKTWKITSQSLGFNSYGEMIDGHHRCEACVATGLSFDTIVVMGLEPSAAGYIDCGRSRSTNQRLSASSGEKVNQKRIQVLTRMIQVDNYTQNRPKSMEHLRINNIPLEAINKFERLYGHGIDFAFEHLKSSYHCSMLASVAKAYYALNKYGMEIKDLERFCSIFVTGMYDSAKPHEFTAVVCKNRFFDLSGRKKSDKTVDIQGLPVYLKMSYYLDAFFQGIVVNGSGRIKYDPFPFAEPISKILKEDGDLYACVEKSIKEVVCAVG